jgi:hypothetical protein
VSTTLEKEAIATASDRPHFRALPTRWLTIRIMGVSDFRGEWDHHYVASVRRAAQTTLETAAGSLLHEVFLVLTEELRRRGVEPESGAVFDGALLISQGRTPAVLTCSVD